MNPDQPSREQIEARLTALLLGELPEAEAEVLRWTISRDPELQNLHDQLKQTIGFVREAVKNPANAPVEKETLLKMSQERRQALLAHFKSERPKPLVPPLRRRMSPLIPTLVAVALIAVLAAILLPVINASKTRSLHMVGNLSALNEMQEKVAGNGDLELEQKANSHLAGEDKSGKFTPPAPTTTPPLAQIVLPNTETSKKDGTENSGSDVFSQSIVGYVNVRLPQSSSGAVTPIPGSGTQIAENGPGSLPETPAPPTATGSVPQNMGLTIAGRYLEQPASSPPAQSKQQIAPTAAGGTYTVAAAPPAPTVYGVVESRENRNGSVPENANIGGSPSTDNTYAMNTMPESIPAPEFTDGSRNIGVNKALKSENQPASQPLLPPRLREEYGHGAEIPHHAPVGVTPIPGEAGPEIAELGPGAAEVNASQPGGTIPAAPTQVASSVSEDNGVEQAPKVLFGLNSGSTISGKTFGGGAGGGGGGGGQTQSSEPNTPNNGTVSFGSGSTENGPFQNRLQSVLAEATNETPYGVTGLSSTASSSDYDVTDAIAMNQPQDAYPNSFHGSVRSAGNSNQSENSALISREIPKSPIVLDNKDRLVSVQQSDIPLTPPKESPLIPQPEILTRDNAFSTFSLNVSDVSFKLAAVSLQNGRMPDPASIRTEEFINAFDYHDPEPLQGQPLAFTSERALDPFEHERDLLRFSIKAAAMGRQDGRALNLVLLLDTSGSMECADRVAIIRETLRVLASQLQPQDTVSVVTFARTARLWADGVPGAQAGATLDKVGSITPDGGTNLEEAMRLAYETALRHFLANGMNRVVLLTDGAANLGNVDPQALTQKVEAERRQGIALDCFGIGWEDYNDDLLEQLSSHGDGRYAFINSPDEAATDFAAKLAGALQVAAEDVKVQVEFNPNRVTAWRQIGYAKHQLTKEQFRDNSVAAGAIAAREAGNALYAIETKPDGQGPIATVRVRYRVPGTQDNHERSWLVEDTGAAPALAQSSPAMRLEASAAEFSEWLAGSPFAQNVTPDELLNDLNGVPQFYGADKRPGQLEWMIRQAKSVSGK